MRNYYCTKCHLQYLFPTGYSGTLSCNSLVVNFDGPFMDDVPVPYVECGGNLSPVDLSL